MTTIPLRLAWLLSGSLLATSLVAQPAPTGPGAVAAAAAVAASGATGNGVPVPATIAPATLPTGETSLTLDIGFGIRYVPPARVTVPAGEVLRVSAPALGPLQWFRNGRVIAGATSTTLTIDSVQSADAGSYSATYTEPAMAGRGSQGLILGVGPADRLLNLSVRGTINAGPGQNFLAGFVVAPGTSGKKLILRAIGPSLAAYGITDPLARPAIRILDARGAPYQNGYAYPAVVGGPTYESDLAESLARCGAFPIAPGTKDVVIMMPFIPGSYVAEVTSADLAAGTVLFEVYEVP